MYIVHLVIVCRWLLFEQEKKLFKTISFPIRSSDLGKGKKRAKLFFLYICIIAMIQLYDSFVLFICMIHLYHSLLYDSFVWYIYMTHFVRIYILATVLICAYNSVCSGRTVGPRFEFKNRDHPIERRLSVWTSFRSLNQAILEG